MEECDPKEIKPYEYNNRVHSAKQISNIAQSIKKYGFNQPIVVDEAGVCIIGHGRLLAAIELGLKRVPIIRKVGLSEQDKRAYRILDNKLQNDSAWDCDNLGLELDWLEGNGFALEPWGLDALRDLFKTNEEVADDEFEPSEPSECFVKEGDEIELGRHRVWCADFRKVAPPKCNMWLTDPPYGVAYVGKTKEALTLENDDLSDEGTEKLWLDATQYALGNLEEGSPCYATVPAGPLNYIFLKVWVELLVIRQQLVWAKDSMVLGHSDYHYRHEPILYGWTPGKHYFVNDRTKTSVLCYDRPKASREHPTMKPLALWGELIQNSTKTDECVLDTFLGSGTTLIACEELNRTCYGMEIEPRYCEVIIQRYKEYCGKHGKAFICKVNGQVYGK